MKKLVCVAICSLALTAAYSQRGRDVRQQKREEKAERVKQLLMQEEQGSIIFQRQTIFGIKLNTDGYGMFLEFGRQKTPRKSNLYSIEIGERKHSKEEKIAAMANSYLSNPYIYGKINNFYYTKLGFSQSRIIGTKGNKNGVAVSAIYGAGLTGGFLKPYYLKVADPQSNAVKDIKYSGTNADAYLNNPNLILGASGFSKGFGEMKFTPGAYVKTAMRFDYGRYNELVSAIEVGLNIELYSQKMPMVLLTKDKQMFFNAYAAIAFGRRK